MKQNRHAGSEYSSQQYIKQFFSKNQGFKIQIPERIASQPPLELRRNLPFCKKIDANEKNFEIIEIGSFKNRTFCKVRIKDEELCWVLKEEVEEKHVHKLLEFYEKRIVIVQESDDDLQV